MIYRITKRLARLNPYDLAEGLQEVFCVLIVINSYKKSKCINRNH